MDPTGRHRVRPLGLLVQRGVRAPSVAARAPWVLAFVFGLLHGFGFAGTLSELGLPPGQIPAALVCFNLGVEAGQLLFVGGVLAIIALWNWASAKRRLATLNSQPSTLIRLLPPYAIGGVAMFWVIEGIAAL